MEWSDDEDGLIIDESGFECEQEVVDGIVPDGPVVDTSRDVVAAPVEIQGVGLRYSGREVLIDKSVIVNSKDSDDIKSLGSASNLVVERSVGIDGDVPISAPEDMLMDDSVIILDSDTEDPPEKTEVKSLLSRELEQSQGVLDLHRQERDLLQTQVDHYKRYEKSSLEDLRMRLGEIDQVNQGLKTELSSTQRLVQQPMTEVMNEFKQELERLSEGFPRADMGAVMLDLKGMIKRVTLYPERLAGAIRRANKMQAVKSAHMDVAQNRIRELTDAVRSRRDLDAEIADATHSYEQERSRLNAIVSLRSQCDEKLASLELKMVAERQRQAQLEKDKREAGSSTGADPPKLSKWAKRRRAMTPEKRAAVKAKQRKSNSRNLKKLFSYIGRAEDTIISKRRVTAHLDSKGIKRAENILTIGSYVRVKRRLILRNLPEPNCDSGIVIEKHMLTRISRFWLCVARWQYLQSLKKGQGVKGANRSTRIEVLARELHVPKNLVRAYKDANAETYDYYPPASYDLRVVECEQGREYPKKWPIVRKLERNLGGSDSSEGDSEENSEEDSAEDSAEDSEEDVEE